MEEHNNGISLQKNEKNEPAGVSGTSTAVQTPLGSNTKFCKFCGGQIPMEAVICTACGRQVEQLQGGNLQQPSQIVINNSNSANASATATVGMPTGKKKSKWVCFLLWLFLGLFGGHKFYDGKIGTGIVYIFTLGFLGIGWFIDFFRILNKPNPYYV